MLDLREELDEALAGRYSVERELGRGGMAIVYLARDLKHGRLVALKVMRPELSTSIAVDRFLREIRIAARLTHPNILSLHDSGEANGLLYYVMPYVAGESLRHRLERERQLPIVDAVAIARQVAAALDFAHAEGVVHRDVKPENILLLGEHALVADFGLARAVHSAASPRLTDTGVAVGTPAYISPEQASAEQTVDGRTDVYSLACVVFEMIAGVPPFRGATTQAIITHHVVTPPPSLCAERASCPPRIDTAVRRALAKVPADRYRTAGEFVRELDAAVGGRAVPVGPPASLGARQWRWATGALAGIAAVAGAVLVVKLASGRAAPLDASRYVVLPLTAADSGASARSLTQDATSRLREALAQWTDVRLVDDRTTRDALDEARRSELRTSEALHLAQRLGAGRLIWGDVAARADSVSIHATLYDVASGSAVRTAQMTYPSSSKLLGQQFRELANGLLRDRRELPWRSPEQSWPASLAAWSAYDAGRRALDSWDLPGAEKEFRDALRIDPQLPQAQLWLSQLLVWSTQNLGRERTARAREEERVLAQRALSLGARLSERDRAAAAGVLALAEQRYPDACGHFRSMTASVPNDFAAWYGIGECLSLDSAVVVDKRSPSGFAFRGSWQSAAAGYEHALDVVSGQPPSFPYERLKKVLFTETTHFRIGRTESDRSIFVAQPVLLNDTLAFIPRPAQTATSSPARLADVSRAIDANLARLGRSFRAWVRLSPREPRAHELLGTLLEQAGIIVSDAADSASALSEIRAAQVLTTDSLGKLKLSEILVRLAVKADSFALAASLADSLLDNVRQPTIDQAPSLVGLAALVGDRQRTARLLAPLMALPTYGLLLPDGRPVSAPPAVLRLTAEAHSRAVFGICDESLRDFSSRLQDMLASYVPDSASQAKVRNAASWRVLSAAVPCLGTQAVKDLDTRDFLVQLQQTLARGGPGPLRARFDTLQSLRKGLRPGDVPVDYTFQESWLLLAAGDTVAAARHLDRSLNALPTLSNKLLDFPSQAASLVRAMALRATVAARRGESATASRWANAVATLWAHADPALTPVVQQMRVIAQGGH